jgi:hypothetical protein
MGDSVSGQRSEVRDKGFRFGHSDAVIQAYTNLQQWRLSDGWEEEHHNLSLNLSPNLPGSTAVEKRLGERLGERLGL